MGRAAAEKKALETEKQRQAQERKQAMEAKRHDLEPGAETFGMPDADQEVEKELQSEEKEIQPTSPGADL